MVWSCRQCVLVFLKRISSVTYIFKFSGRLLKSLPPMTEGGGACCCFLLAHAVVDRDLFYFWHYGCGSLTVFSEGLVG